MGKPNVFQKYEAGLYAYSFKKLVLSIYYGISPSYDPSMITEIMDPLSFIFRLERRGRQKKTVNIII